jgi:hypothetical protein
MKTMNGYAPANTAPQRNGALFTLKIEPNTIMNPHLVKDAYENYTRALDIHQTLEKEGASTQAIENAQKGYQRLYQKYLGSLNATMPIEALHAPGKAIVEINKGLRTYFKQHFGETLPQALEGKPLINEDNLSAQTSFDIKPTQHKERLALLTSLGAIGQPKPYPLNLVSAYTITPHLGLDSCREALSTFAFTQGLNFPSYKYQKGIPELKLNTLIATQPSEKGLQSVDALLELEQSV